MSAPLVNNSSGTATVVLRNLLPKPPTTKPGDAGEIEFCHPGYEPPYDVLFLFPRLDHTSTSLKGVHYGTALTACQIIANNAFDGYLATDQEGRERVGPDINLDHVLTESKYWFFVPTGQNPSPNPCTHTI
ncbi:hypothetical protein GGS24DRAFT_485805 [Hypoxylon argillaceum]|nr:hypothetical protein GGS24DRAFT_485805 [Hypoxylon argillaceum]